MIDSYAFGRIEVNGHTYTSDLIIFPSSIRASWRRRSGHRLVLDDVPGVFEEEPEVLIIGTGCFGRMKVSDEVKRRCDAASVSLLIERTEKAVSSFNRLQAQKRIVAALHLTC